MVAVVYLLGEAGEGWWGKQCAEGSRLKYMHRGTAQSERPAWSISTESQFIPYKVQIVGT